MCKYTEKHTLYSLALVGGVRADGVVSYELVLGSCSMVLWWVNLYVLWWVFSWEAGGRVTESAGPAAETLWLIAG